MVIIKMLLRIALGTRIYLSLVFTVIDGAALKLIAKN